MDYTSRYGLEFNPFLKNSKDILVETQEFKELRFRLDYLLSTRGFGLLTGSPGRGKTTAIRSWAAKLNPSLYKVIYSSLSTLTVVVAVTAFSTRPVMSSTGANARAMAAIGWFRSI